MKMAAILVTMLAILIGIVQLQKPSSEVSSRFLPCPATEPTKRAYEIYTLIYTAIWIGIFAFVVAFQVYESLDAWGYLYLCGGLSLPFLLQPFLLPSCGMGSPDERRKWYARYSTKANLWIAVYSFIGNYWYTHYFYSVLKASYSMPAHRLNNVPIALYFATHFYFSTYHAFSNVLLRWVTRSFEKGLMRNILVSACRINTVAVYCMREISALTATIHDALPFSKIKFWSVVISFSYFTAFMETLTISSYPYYSFEDKHMAYTTGSAFYGIYFLVSFPTFFYFETQIDYKQGKHATLWDTLVSSCGAGMMILCLLDFVRLYIGVNLVVGGA